MNKIDEIKKGCGKEFFKSNDGAILVCSSVSLCDECKAKLEGYEQGQKDSLEEDMNENYWVDEDTISLHCECDDKCGAQLHIFRDLDNQFELVINNTLKEKGRRDIHNFIIDKKKLFDVLKRKKEVEDEKL